MKPNFQARAVRFPALFILLAAWLGASDGARLRVEAFEVIPVGFVNVTSSAGYSLIANQLDNGRGNRVDALFQLSRRWRTL